MPTETTPSVATTSTAVVVTANKNHIINPAKVPTRVLHVINGEHFSGAERVQQHLGKQLGTQGFDPIFACVKPGKFRECCELRKYQVVDTPMRGRFDLSVVGKLSKVANDNRAMLLHAHTPRTALVTARAARALNLPWVYHVHSPTSRDSTRGIINRINTWIERYSIRNCDLLMTVSKSLRREMLRLGVPRQKLAVVPNGVSAIEPIDPDARLAEEQWKLGMVALMRPRKGVEIAIEALAILKQQSRPVALQLIGGFETEEYERETLGRIKSAGVEDCVNWTGFTRDVPSAVRGLDALLLPSLFGEGMPMVVLEAISAGVPVVATQVEGTPEVIRHGVEGYLAKPGDESCLAEAICQMTSDRTAWAKLSRSALQRHRSNFSDIAMAQRVAKAYRRLL